MMTGFYAASPAVFILKEIPQPGGYTKSASRLFQLSDKMLKSIVKTQREITQARHD
jgi:hypothetical protein